MAIPLATTTITATRIEAAQTVDDYDADQPAPTTIATGVRATVGPPSATTELVGGRRVEYSARFACDPTPLQPGDTVTDGDGNTWRVIWAQQVSAFGNTHTFGELRATTGTT